MQGGTDLNTIIYVFNIKISLTINTYMILYKFNTMRLIQAAGFVIRKVYRQNQSCVLTIPEKWIEAEYYKKIKNGERLILEPVK